MKFKNVNRYKMKTWHEFESEEETQTAGDTYDVPSRAAVTSFVRRAMTRHAASCW